MKTKCKCNICGFENSGNSKWQVERDMWDHIKNAHPTDVLKFDDEKQAINIKIATLVEAIPSLYSTEQQGKVEKGNWTV